MTELPTLQPTISPASRSHDFRDFPVHLINLYPEANVVLLGGPPSLPPDKRIRHVTNISDKVKLRLGNRYEHFQPTSEVRRFCDRDLHVFFWTGRTYVAE